MKFKIILKNILHIILILSIIISSSVLPVFAVSDITAEEIINDSVIIRAHTPYYFKNGQKHYFDEGNEYYTPDTDGSDIRLSLEQLKKLIDFSYSYDANDNSLTVKNSSVTLVFRIGEDKVVVNGKEQYLSKPVIFNGVRTLVFAAQTAKLLGYNVDLFNGMIIISTHNEISENFEASELSQLVLERVLDETMSTLKKVGENSFVLPNYSFTASGTKIDETMRGYESGQSGNCAYLDAVSQGYIGIKSASVPFDNEYIQYNFSFEYKKNQYQGNKLMLVICYYNGTKEIAQQKYKIDDTANSEWNKYTVSVGSDDYKDIDADTLKFIIATENNSQDFSGRVYLRNFSVDCYKNVAKIKSEIEDKVSAMFFDGLYSNGFEDTSGVSFKTWGDATENGFSDKISFEGERSAYINAVQRSMAAFTFPYVYNDPPENRVNVEYNVKANVYVTEDYVNNEPYALLSLSNKGTWKRMVYATSDKAPLPGQWTEITFKFLYRTIYRNDLVESGPNDTFIFGVGTRAVNVSETSPAKGQIYFDNVRFEIASCTDDSTSLQFLPDNKLGWYVLGDTIRYSISNKEKDVLNGFESIEAIIYNIDNDIVYKNKISVDKFLKDGWSWTPKDVTGSLAVEFYGVRKDGTKSVFEYLQRVAVDNVAYECNITKHRFVVAAKQTKPQSERNAFPGINASSDLGMQLADKIGFSAVRYHYVRWGDSQLFKGTHLGPGQFDWTSTDELFASMDKNEMKLMVNIFGSPKWALPEEFQGVTGGMVAGGMVYNGYGIQNQEYVKEYMNAFLERYGKKLEVIEFWNEPGAQSAFWYDHENDDVLIKMLKTTHECVEAYNEKNGTDIKIAFAGFLRSQEQWLVDFLKIDPDVKSYYDIFSIHGRYNQAYRIYDYVFKELNEERKPWINSETYSTTLYYDRDEKTGLTNTNLHALAALMNYFYHIKVGAGGIFEFRDTADVGDEYVGTLTKNGGSLNYWSLATNFTTHIEPIPLSYILNVFFDLMGKDFKYDKEYLLSDGQVAVKFVSDKKSVIALWNKDTKNSVLDSKLKAGLKDDSYIMDFEGHRLEKGNFNLQGNKLYWIINADENALDKLIDTPDGVLNPNNVEPHFTASVTQKEAQVPVSELNVPKAKLTSGKLFDETTFNVVNDNINWIDTDWNWVGAGYEKPEDFSARFAASYTEDGFYLMVDVKDGIFGENAEEGTMKNFWNYDGIQFAFDTQNSSNSADRMECAAADTLNGTYVYKVATPDFGEQLITDYTKQGVYIENRYVNISDTENGKMYKIFFPINELFPMSYPYDKDSIRFSLLINNNNTFGRMGYLEWSSGIGGAKSPSQYGALTFPDE